MYNRLGLLIGYGPSPYVIVFADRSGSFDSPDCELRRGTLPFVWQYTRIWLGRCQITRAADGVIIWARQ